MKKILLINTSLRPNSPVKMFPVGLGYIATVLNDTDHKLDIMDLDLNCLDVLSGEFRNFIDDTFFFLEKHDKIPNYDYIMFGSIVSGYKMIKELAAQCRSLWPEAVIVVGNTVAGSIPDLLLKNTETNIAVIGEGDQAVLDVLNWTGPETKAKIQSKVPCEIDSLPWINFDLFDTESYIRLSPLQISDPLPSGLKRSKIRMLPINTARGCPHNCTFCYHSFKGIPYRKRSFDNIRSEIEFLKDKYNINYVGFSDELTFHNHKRLNEFFDSFDQFFGVWWMANTRADLFRKPEDVDKIKRMKKLGCHGFSFSLENADPIILAAMNKRLTVDQFKFQTELVHKAGLPVWTSLVFGYPQETPKTIKATFDACAEVGVYPSVGFLLPQPGSVMYQWARSNGYISNEEKYLLNMGDRQDLRLNMTKMSNEEFFGLVREEALKCAKAVGVDVGDDPIRTQYYRGKNNDIA